MSEPIAADWSAADLHAHTRASDGMDSAETMLAAAVAAGLDCTAITEHDQIDGALRAQSIAIERRPANRSDRGQRSDIAAGAHGGAVADRAGSGVPLGRRDR